jgi:transposase-like protein
LGGCGVAKRREYTDAFKASALLHLKANRGNADRTAKALGIPRSTLLSWEQGVGVTAETLRLVELGAGELADLMEHQVRQMLMGITREKIEQASLRDLMVAIGVGTDKVQVLRGMPNSITKSVDMTDDEAAERAALLIDQALARLDGGSGAEGTERDAAGAAGGAEADAGPRGAAGTGPILPAPPPPPAARVPAAELP